MRLTTNRSVSGFVELDTTVWRVLFADENERALESARAPEGRFHRSGQVALYASLSQAGAWGAVEPYRRAGDRERVAVPLIVRATVADATDRAAAARLGVNSADCEVDWRAQRLAGVRPESWRASDRVRAAGLDGLLYRSRRQPERRHLVLFRWNQPGAARLDRA